MSVQKKAIKAVRAAKTTSKQVKNSQIQRGSGVYNCTSCKRATRATGRGDNENLKQCVECYEIAGIENQIADTRDEAEKAKLQAEIAQLTKQRDAKIADAKRKKTPVAAPAVEQKKTSSKKQRPAAESASSKAAAPHRYSDEEFAKVDIKHQIKAHGQALPSCSEIAREEEPDESLEDAVR